MHTLLRACLCAGLALLLGPSASAATYVVDSLSDDPAQTSATPDGTVTLREALIAANSNAAYGDAQAGSAAGIDVITFSVSGTITLQQGQLSVMGTLNLQGSGITIEASEASRHFMVASAGAVQFSGLTLLNGGSVARGGSIYNDGSRLTINGGAIRFNRATGPAATDGGGGIYNDGGRLTLRGGLLIGRNRASGTSGSGGGVFNATGGTVTAENVRFVANRANRAGGGIEDASGVSGGTLALNLRDVEFTANVAGPLTRNRANPGNGGAIHLTGAGDSRIQGGSVRSNQAALEGGGLWNGTGTMTVQNVAISRNTAFGDGADDGGGGVFNAGGTVRITGGSISRNVASGASGSGGGIHNRGILSVAGTSITNNTANRAGGGIEDVGEGIGTPPFDVALFSTTLTDVTLSGNNAGMSPGNGGGFHSGGGKARIRGGSVTGNVAVEGGGLWSSGSMTVRNTSITGNTATGDDADHGGGGVFNQGGLTVLLNTTVRNNSATGASGSGGGVFHNGGSTRIQGGTIEGNTASRAGGGLEAATGGAVALADVDFTGNSTGSAPGNGGAVHVTAGTVTAVGGTVSGNTAASEGGGFWSNAGFTMRVEGTTFTNNTAAGDDATNGGGALFNNGGMLVVENVMIMNNSATGTSGSGGGVFNDGGMLAIIASTIEGNTANRAGGGVETAGGNVEITDTDINGNDAGTAPGNGGGVHIGGAAVVNVTTSRFDGNTAVEGAGLWNSGSGKAVVLGTSFMNGSATRGGGVYQSGTAGRMDVRQSLLASNSASTRGGGMFVEGGEVTVSNTTLSGNTANEGAGVAQVAGRIQVSSATVALNQAATRGGGARILGGTFAVGNTIFFSNAAPQGATCFGSIVSRDYILFDTRTGCTVASGTTRNSIQASAMLEPLADNGGPTMTHASMPGSPAIDNGQAPEAVDQRGFTRDQGQDDIGAYEFGASAPATVASGDVEGDGALAKGDTADEVTMDGPVRLDPVAPNPLVAGRAGTVSFAVREAQAVVVSVYDVAGRRVATLYSGTPEAGRTETVSLGTADLAAGLYIVRLAGETVQATQRVTLVR